MKDNGSHVPAKRRWKRKQGEGYTKNVISFYLSMGIGRLSNRCGRYLLCVERTEDYTGLELTHGTHSNCSEHCAFAVIFAIVVPFARGKLL